jgi:hypothetical protein
MNEIQTTNKQQPTPADLIAMAVDKNLDVDKLERLLAMQREWQAEQNRKLFFESLATFQSKCPEIRKNKRVHFTTQNGGSTDYNYAPLADIERQIKDLLMECGLTKRWETSEENGKLVVSCIITHTSGHSEKTSMGANPDDSGKKNNIQSRGSSITYLQRYTLICALGIGTADNDIDGRFTEKSVDELHQEYMKEYDQLIAIDSTLSKWHPDNWAVDRTVANYVLALGAIRKVLFEKQPKK